MLLLVAKASCTSLATCPLITPGRATGCNPSPCSFYKTRPTWPWCRSAFGASLPALGLSNKAVYADADEEPAGGGNGSSLGGDYTDGPDFAPNAAPSAVAGEKLILSCMLFKLVYSLCRKSWVVCQSHPNHHAAMFPLAEWQGGAKIGPPQRGRPLMSLPLSEGIEHLLGPLA